MSKVPQEFQTPPSSSLVSAIPSADEWSRLKEICTIAVRSGLIPLKNVEQAIAVALKGRELRIPPMTAFAKISIINGKPALEAELMVALIYRDIPGAKIEFLETNDKICRLRFTRPGEASSDWSFTIEEAKIAGLTSKGPWKTYPTAMLRARCISAMARAKAADALMGCSYVPEELGAEPTDPDYIDVEPSKSQEKPKEIETTLVEPEKKEPAASKGPYLIRLPDVPQKRGDPKPHLLNGKTIEEAHLMENRFTKHSLLKDSYDWYRTVSHPSSWVVEFLEHAEAFYKKLEEEEAKKETNLDELTF